MGIGIGRLPVALPRQRPHHLLSRSRHGHKEGKKSQLWKQRSEKDFWRVPPCPAGVATRSRARASRTDRTYGCPRGRRGRRGCPRGRRGRARRAGVAGEGRQRADVEGHEPAAGRGGGRVGAEARLPDITRRENLHVRRIRSCYQFHSPFASSNCKNRASAGEFRQAIDLFSRACYFQNRCKKIQPKFAPNSNSSEGKHGGRQPEQRESRLAPTRLQVI